MKQFWQILFFVMVVGSAAMGGVLMGQKFMSRGDTHRHAAGDMHALFHHDLHLSTQQDKVLVVIETDFRHQKTLLEEQMKSSNIELAEAIKNGGYSSPQVLAVVDQIHETMGGLQKLTLQHLADMQAVLDEAQSKRLEEKVVGQLYRNARQ
tara:strand:+ start:211333 stop:211785 length:453 start_codon:yes stop_codon:yes gene_type:complete